MACQNVDAMLNRFFEFVLMSPTFFNQQQYNKALASYATCALTIKFEEKIVGF